MKMLLAGVLFLCAASPAAGVDLTFSAIKINEATIPVSRVLTDLDGRQQASQMLHGSAPGTGSVVKKVEQATDRIIVRELLMQEARRRGYAVTQAELSAAWEAERARWGDEARFVKSLDVRGVTAVYLKERLAEDLLQHKLVQALYAGIAVAEPDERAHYAKHPELSAAPKKQLRLLYIDSKKHGGEQGTFERYKLFRVRLDNGETFAKLIEEYSDHPTASAGGAIDDSPEPPLPFMESTGKLWAGQFTQPRNDDRGLYSYYRDRNPLRLPFEEVRPKVRQALIDELRKERLDKLIRELRAAARIEFLP